ncbi:MAG: NupC/NupG family nucleoside CNT transporter [Verrucomicrobiales bacterium]
MFENISRGFIGIVVLLGICLLLSTNRKAINWRLIIGGIILQLTIAVLILKTPFALVVTWLSGAFIKLVGFTEAGSGMLFGELLDAGKFGLAFKVLPTIIFVSALTSVLYYFGILQRIVFGFAWIMKRLMRLSGAESLAAAANVFIGQTEAPLVVRPYIAKMTRSELMALMTGGMATIAGSVFLIYVEMVSGGDEALKLEVGRQLLTASMMNAPAALLIAKLLVPETEEIDEKIEVPRDKQGVNVLDALANGTTEGLKLMFNVGAMLLVFFAVIAMVNWGFGWVGGLGGGWLNNLIASLSGGVFETFSLQAFIGFVFAPLGWVIGGGSGDILQLGQLLGTKMVATEFVAYQELGEMTSTLSPKSVFLATFALCGFANFGSIGIQLGGIGALAPERRSTLAKLGFKAMIGGTLASLLTASIAGMFF